MEYCPRCLAPNVSGQICPVCGSDLTWKGQIGLELPVGTTLTGENGLRTYWIGAARGKGGFGITYGAVELYSHRRVAIKEYFPMYYAFRCGNDADVQVTAGKEQPFQGGMKSFLDEARMLLAQEDLPSVVHVIDFFQANGTAYLVMEFLDGLPLFAYMSRVGGVIPAQTLLQKLEPLIRDLGTLHQKGVLHRDISPDNLMWMPDGTIKLIDFGSARRMQADKSMTTFTKEGFSPIEQLLSGKQGPYTDIYALAATIYYCITNTFLPGASSRLKQDTLRSPAALGADLTPEQERAILWGLSVQPNARPQTIAEFYHALYGHDILSPAPGPKPTIIPAPGPSPVPGPIPVPRPTPTPRPKPNPRPDVGPKPKPNTFTKAHLIPIACGLLAGVLILAVALFSNHDNPMPENTWVPDPPVYTLSVQPAISNPGTEPSAALPTPEPTGNPVPLSTEEPSAAPTQAPTPELTPEPTSEPTPAPSSEPNMPFTPAGGVPVYNATDLLGAMKDNRTDMIRIPSGCTIRIIGDITIQKDVILEQNSALILDSGDVTLTANLWVSADATVSFRGNKVSITKDRYGQETGALFVVKGGSLYASCHLVRVTSGAGLYLDGQFTCSGLLETQANGTITIGSHGSAVLDVLVLEKASDLTMRGLLSAGNTFVVNDDIFQSAVSVESTEELEAALRNPSVPAVRIAGSLQLSHNITADKPLLISEGANLTSESGSNVCLTIRSLLINKGSIDAITLNVDGGTLLNDFTASATVSLTGNGGTVLNKQHGTINLLDSDWQASKFFNLGTLYIGKALSHSVHAVFRGGELWNVQDGVFVIENGSTATLDLELGYHDLGGSLSVSSKATLVNHSVLSGNISLLGTVENEGGVLKKDKVNQWNDIRGGLSIVEELERRNGVTGTTLLLSATSTDGVTVTNTEGFIQAYNQREDILILSGTVEIDQSLLVRHHLTISENATLIIHGTLTITDGVSLNVIGNLTADELVMKDSYLTSSQAVSSGAANGIHIAHGGDIRLAGTNAVLDGVVSAEETGSRFILEEDSMVYSRDKFSGFSLSLDGCLVIFGSEL